MQFWVSFNVLLKYSLPRIRDLLGQCYIKSNYQESCYTMSWDSEHLIQAMGPLEQDAPMFALPTHNYSWEIESLFTCASRTQIYPVGCSPNKTLISLILFQFFNSILKVFQKCLSLGMDHIESPHSTSKQSLYFSWIIMCRQSKHRFPLISKGNQPIL